MYLSDDAEAVLRTGFLYDSGTFRGFTRALYRIDVEST